MRKLGSSLSVGLGVMLLSGGVLAQSECETSDDCGAGMECEVVGSSGCAAAPCAEGADCEPVPECETEEFMACVPGPCETDADCGEDMVCQTQTWKSCGGSSGTCDSEGNCTDVEVDVECEEGTTSQCVYRWQAGCEEDADCGEGFTCESYDVGCDCAASGGDTGGEADADPAGDPAIEPAEGNTDGEAERLLPPEEPEAAPIECVCAEPEKVNYCEPVKVECATEADCPDGWSCESQADVTCGGETDVTPDEAPAPAEGGEGFAPPADGEGGGSGGAEGDPKEPPPDDTTDEKPLEDPCQPVESPKMCVPPGGWGYDTGTGGVATGSESPRDDAAGDPNGEGDDGVDGEPNVDDEVEDGESPPGKDDAEEPIDDEEPTDEDGTDDEEPTDEDDGSSDDPEEDDADASGDNSDDGGCSVQAGSTRSASALWLSGLLGLAFLRRRRH